MFSLVHLAIGKLGKDLIHEQYTPSDLNLTKFAECILYSWWRSTMSNKSLEVFSVDQFFVKYSENLVIWFKILIKQRS